MDSNHVVVHERDTIRFPFLGDPYVEVRYGSSTRHIPVDTFPGYEHDRFVAEDHLKHVSKCFPIDQDVTINLFCVETTARVNGRAETVTPEDDRAHGVIILDGKRTPIHPAMTRYLVAHEYGHLVQAEIERIGNMQPGQFEAIYAEMRGMKLRTDYGGGTWHLSTAEVFANDFRLLMCRSEVMFWPHRETPRPEEVTKLSLMWEALKRDYAFREDRTELALAS